ncbi:restin homolog isoform X3 [Anopheles cruzii]|uniref:restin homolog isoform X3 n=1 Tax=Anopheles cruzii TaxID=68878 RepID=UPI0022EC3BDD|nr:restin homolog isoform X3 [Anopheles cruzii]
MEESDSSATEVAPQSNGSSEMAEPSEPAAVATGTSSSVNGGSVRPPTASGIQPPKVRAIAKPSGIKPPSANFGGSTTSLASTSSQLTTASAATGTGTATVPSSGTRIGRLCLAHGTPKAGPPPPDPKLVPSLESKMRRPSDSDYSKSHLPDVDEESETDVLTFERPMSARSSRSPDSGFKSSRSDRKTSSASTGSDGYWEATGRRRSSDQGAVLTSDTDSFIIGQRVWVGGIRQGQIVYIGDTHFAPGEWAGVVLDEPNGKNDGSVAGKRYFQCEPRKGVFSRLTRLTREQLGGGGGGGGADSTASTPLDASFRSLTSPARSGTVSPTHSVQSYASKSPAVAGKAASLNVGDRVIVSSGFGSRPGMLKYLGETKFASGTWCGVQLDDASGKNDGTVDGVRYFECPAKCGIFVPIAKVTLSPSARKTSARLSRSNSKESLNSLATMSSIATTATSRLRMSAQRKSSAAATAVPSTPKASFSLQDVLREKQNHIEQLMQEREIDREESANQSIMYQKNIQQLKEKVATMEKQLSDEKRRNEDLQFSVDEATIFGEDHHVKTDLFQKRVVELEAQLAGGAGSEKESSAASPSGMPPEDASVVRAQLNADIDKLKTDLLAKDQKLNLTEKLKRSLEDEIQNLHEKVAETERSAARKLSAVTISEECLKEQVNYLEHRVDEQSDQLTAKDAELEKQYLALKNVEGELDERVTALQAELRSREEMLEARDKNLQKLDAEMEALRNDLRQRDLKMAEGESGIKGVLQEKDSTIGSLKEQLQAAEQSLAAEGGQRTRLEQELQTITQRTAELEVDRETKTKALEVLEVKLAANEQSLQVEVSGRQEKESLVCQLENQLKDLGKADEVKASLLGVKEEALANATNQLTVLEAAKSKLETELNTLRQSFDGTCAEKDAKLGELQTSVDADQEALETARKQLHMAEQENLAKDKQLEEEEVLVAALQKELKELSASNANLSQELTTTRSSFADKDGTLAKLLEEKNALELQLQRNNEASAENLKRLEAEFAQRELSWREETEQRNAAVQQELSGRDAKLAEVTLADEQHQKQLEAARQSLAQLEEKVQQTEAALAAKNEQAQSLEQQLAGLRAELAGNEEQAGKLNVSLTEGTARLEANEKKLSEVQEQYGRLEIEHADLRRKMEALEQKSATVQAQKVDLERELDTLRSTTLDSNSELAKVTEELKGRQRALEQLQDGYNTLKIDSERRADESAQCTAALQDQVERLRHEMQQITDQKIVQENELNTELRKIKELAEQEKDNLVREIAALRASFDEERQRLSNQLVEQVAKETSLSAQLTAATEQQKQTIAQHTAELERLRAEWAQERGTYDTKAKEATEREERLSKQLEASRTEAKGLTEALQTLRQSTEQGSAKLSEALEQKAQNVTRLEKELAQQQVLLEQRSQDVGEMIEKLDAGATKQAELLQQLAACQEEIQVLGKAKADSEKACQETRKQLADLNSSYGEMEDEQVDLVSREEALKKELTQLEDRLQTTANEHLSQLGILNERNNDLLKLVDTTTTAKASVEAEVVSLKTQLDAQSSASEALAAKVDELSPLIESSAALSQTVHSLQQTLLAKDSTVQELAKALEESKQQTTLREETLGKVERELEKLRQDVAGKDRNRDDLQSKLDASERMLTEQSEREKRASEEMAELRRTLEQGRNTAREQEDRVKEQQRRISELETKLAAQSTQFDELLDRKKCSETEHSARLHELTQKLLEMENGKRSEIQELEQRLATLVERAEAQAADTVQTVSNHQRAADRRQQELECAKKDLELRETELQLANRRLEKDNERMRAELLARESEVAKLSKAASSAAGAATTMIPAMAGGGDANNETGAQIDFLNSIIVDMQRKNEKLKLRVQALESTGLDSQNMSFEIQKRKPAPRVFCDICDEFDLHETEDCPKQCSDSPPESLKHAGDEKERKLPPPRKYCESCEVFGHEIGECPDDETY